MSNAWGGHRNGQIPLGAMTAVPGVQKGGFIRSDLAAPLAALRAAFKARFGYDVIILEIYRSFAEQTRLHDGWVRRLPGFNLAAIPGFSLHGWAISVDWGGRVAISGTEEKKWMDANAPAYGFKPTGNGFSPRENWHYDGILSVTANLAGAGNYTPITGGNDVGTIEPNQFNALIARLDITTGILGGLQNVVNDPAKGLFPGVNDLRSEPREFRVFRNKQTGETRTFSSAGHWWNTPAGYPELLVSLKLSRGVEILEENVFGFIASNLVTKPPLPVVLAKLEELSASQVEEFRKAVDKMNLDSQGIDADALASSIALSLAPMLEQTVNHLSDEALAQIAKATADEQAERLKS